MLAHLGHLGSLLAGDRALACASASRAHVSCMHGVRWRRRLVSDGCARQRTGRPQGSVGVQCGMDHAWVTVGMRRHQEGRSAPKHASTARSMWHGASMQADARAALAVTPTHHGPGMGGKGEGGVCAIRLRTLRSTPALLPPGGSGAGRSASGHTCVHATAMVLLRRNTHAVGGAIVGSHPESHKHGHAVHMPSGPPAVC